MKSRVSRTEYVFDKTPVECELNILQPLRFVMVSKTPLESVWDYAVSEYHYLGYNMMFGPRLKYMVFYGLHFLAALSFNQASYKVGPRDNYIGWDDEQRLTHLPMIINNNRFLILPWVKVKNLASHVLSQSIKLIRTDWPAHYNVEPLLLETFVDTTLYKGTCYKASNWTYLGETRGYARKGGLYTYHGNRKGIYVYPLRNDFRKIIGCVERPKTRSLNKDVERRAKTLVLQGHEWSPKLMEQAGMTADEIENLANHLLDYNDYYSDCYIHINQKIFGVTYLTGLMSNLERKSVEPIALQYLNENDVRGFQRFFKVSPWLYDKMKDLYQKRLSSVISAPDAMLTIDPSDFPKKGKESAGVARQHCGALGKTENCQSGVFIGYTSDKGYGLVDCKLYMPEKWFCDDYKDRRVDCAVPGDITFKSKNDIAIELIENTKDKGYFPAKWLGCDSFFGRDAAFLDSVANDFFYFADLMSNMRVFTTDANIVVPQYNGRGKHPAKMKASIEPISVSSIAADNNIPWKTVILGEGAKGLIISDVKCLRVFEFRNYLPGRESWLYIRKLADNKFKYSLSNAPADTPLEVLNRVSLMRWPIEQSFEECKSDLGMDHYEIRSYPGWHRHMLFVFLAQLFLLEIRLRFKKNTNSYTFYG
ncbi:MAG: IS701 family transposase [Oscillospiraceae bacterium]|jgi:SRSO17 transposase|nr:IS701 family transposase [Oscillospiraceae bacterium]